MTSNLALMTDSYKISHWKQYPPRTTKIYSYLESRGGIYPATIFFGLQYYLMEYLRLGITEADVLELERFAKEHFGQDLLNTTGWASLLRKHEGRFPLRIKAVKEGTLVPTSMPLMIIENTDPEFFWLTNYVETLLSKLWYPITIATNSFYCKRAIKYFLERTSGDVANLPFKLHDFGYRGVSSEETAGIGGMSHLVNFQGTDNLAGILYAKQYYSSGMAGFSVPATEHSTMTAWGKDHEEESFLNLLDAYPTGILSVVGDSYDIYKFCDMLCKHTIRQKVMARDGILVVRPDSGDPLEVLSRVLNILFNGYGGSFVKTYKLLNPKIRVLQGDGIDAHMITQICKMLDANRYSVDNLVFGSGGGLLQKFDRDSLKFAIKASYGERYSVPIGGPKASPITGFNIQKDPITSSGKKSKAGKLKLTPAGNKTFISIASSEHTKEQFDGYVDALEPVFENGKILRTQNFDEIRKLTEYYL